MSLFEALPNISSSFHLHYFIWSLSVCLCLCELVNIFEVYLFQTLFWHFLSVTISVFYLHFQMSGRHFSKREIYNRVWFCVFNLSSFRKIVSVPLKSWRLCPWHLLIRWLRPVVIDSYCNPNSCCNRFIALRHHCWFCNVSRFTVTGIYVIWRYIFLYLYR